MKYIQNRTNVKSQQKIFEPLVCATVDGAMQSLRMEMDTRRAVAHEHGFHHGPTNYTRQRIHVRLNTQHKTKLKIYFLNSNRLMWKC